VNSKDWYKRKAREWFNTFGEDWEFKPWVSYEVQETLVRSRNEYKILKPVDSNEEECMCNAIMIRDILALLPPQQVCYP